VSAFGLLTVDVKNDYVQTLVQRDDALDFERLNAAYADLEGKASGALAAEGFAQANVLVTRSADLRYFGQGWEVAVEVPNGHLDRTAADAALDRFHAAHQRIYGYSYAGQSEQRIEWVNLRVTGIGPLARPMIRPRTQSTAEVNIPTYREVQFAEGSLTTAVYARDALSSGTCLEGPAIVEEFGSTTVVLPRQRARVDAFGNLILQRSP
jgi:N-methylhydantoinase A